MNDDQQSDNAPVCSYSGELAAYQIGVAQYNKRTAHQMVGYVSGDHVEQGITDVMKQAFGTKLWATVHDLEGKLLYHSYDADQDGFEAAAGWSVYLQKQKEKPPFSLTEQHQRVMAAMVDYYKDAPEIQPTATDWKLWIEGLKEPMKSGYLKMGFDEAKTALPFRRFYLERNDLGMTDYVCDHLSPEDFEYYKQISDIEPD